MAKTKLIHINWDGPYSLSQLSGLRDATCDYGVYQIYGGHPVYGSNALLYIGKADQQTFGVRVAQESWTLNRNSNDLKVYIGRLEGRGTPDMEEWSKEIALAEKLLIYSHSPAKNSQNVSTVNEFDLYDVHVFNWGNHCDLMAEVSGSRWTSKYFSQIRSIYKIVE